jgi:hypothetical protein
VRVHHIRKRICTSPRDTKLFGINPEAVGLVIAAVLASLLLAAAVWVQGGRVVLVAVLAFAHGPPTTAVFHC